ncbi:MAG: GTPase HflX [Thermoproteota archaeon]
MRTLVAECKVPTVPSRADEVVSMARSIGYDVVETVIQQRKTVHRTYCIGPGKLEDVKLSVQGNDIEAIIFANALPGSQVFKIQKVLGGTDVKVIDRNLLILEVFDHRAMTREAKLQIQLAKLRYTFSWGKEFLRLKGILGEQVGWSGPGEYPFQDYQSAARKRISRLEGELKDVYEKKNLLRNRRRELGVPIVALAGYTQSGKTTFFNRVAGETKDTGLGPFTTLTTFARKVAYNGGFNFMLIDSIGFIEDMHPIILKAFNTTLGEISAADLILLFVDVGEDEESIFRKLTASNYILKRIALNVPLIICANKVDRCTPDELKERKMLLSRAFAGTPQVELSALKGTNTDRVLELAYQQLNGVPLISGEHSSLELQS